MGKPCVELRFSDGRTEVFVMLAPEMILGRSNKAQISLPGEVGLELEHLLLVPRGSSGCWLSVAEHCDDIELGGAPFRSGYVPWGTELRVASLGLRLLESAGPATALRRNWGYLAVSGIALIVSLLLFGGSSASKLGTLARPAHPALFPERVHCPELGEPLERAKELELAADRHSVRYEYDPRDGVSAVLRLEEAAACHAVVENSTEAARLADAASALRRQVESDYAAVRLRLEDLVMRGRGPEIMRAARHLRRFTAHLRGNAYVEWIERIETQAAAKL